MIHTALDFLTRELNSYLRIKTGVTNRDLAVLSSVANANGVVIPPKSLGVSLINIEEDRVAKDQQVNKRNASGVYETRNPDIYLNLYVLISANFVNSDDGDPEDDYIEGLKQLSYVISFFQGRSVFTSQNSPAMVALDANLEKLVVELFSFSFEQMNNFWSVVGTNYLPSVLYKVRMITVQENVQLDVKGIVSEVINKPFTIGN